MTDSPGQFTVPTPPQAPQGGGYPPPVPQQFQPPVPPQQTNQPLAQKGNGLAVAALVLGIIALVFCWVPFLNVLSIIETDRTGEAASPFGRRSSGRSRRSSSRGTPAWGRRECPGTLRRPVPTRTSEPEQSWHYSMYVWVTAGSVAR